MKRTALIAVVMALSSSGFAAGIDSQALPCPALQGLIAQFGYIFIDNPNFRDLVVRDRSISAGAERLQTRSVPMNDTAQCPVNYCIPRAATF